MPRLSSVNWRAAAGLFGFALLLPASLFIAAGRVDWPLAWLNTIAFVVVAVGSRLIALRKNPDLLVERSQAFQAGREGSKAWDRLLMGIVGLVGPLAVWITAGLDDRWDWSPELPLALQWAALGAVVGGYAFATWAMTVNRFFSATVRIQRDRGHTVVSDGPYRFVRHPGYAGGAVVYLALAIALDSLWALVPAILTTIVLVARTALEDKTLQEELPGYREYAARVRYRLLPGIW